MLNTGRFSHWCSLVYQHIWQGLSSLLLTIPSLHDSGNTTLWGSLLYQSGIYALWCQLLPTPCLLMLGEPGLSMWTLLLPLPVSLPSLTLLVSLFWISIHWQDPTLYPKSGPIPKMLTCASSFFFSTCMWISIRYLTFNISKVNCSCFSLVLISFSVVLINGDSILWVAQAKKSRHHHWLLPFSHTLIQTVSKFYCHCLRNAWRIWPLLTRLVVAIHNLLEFCDRVHVEAPSFTPGTYTLFLMQQLKWSSASLLQNPSMILISE